MERALDSLSAAFPALHSAIFVIGICNNVTLLTAAYFRTPHALKSYSVMIKAGALNDIIALCIDLFTMNRIFGIPGNMVNVLSTGSCALISPQACYWAYCFQVVSILYSIYALAASFAFRLWVLHQHIPKIGNVKLIMIALFIPPAVAMYAFTFAQGKEEDIRELVNASFPELLSEEGALTGQAGMTTLSTIVVLYVTITPAYAYVTCLFCRRKVLNFLREQTSMSERTLRMHKDLIMALTVHAMIPPIYFIVTLLYAIMFFGIYRHAAMEKAMFLIGTIPSSLAPLCTLYYVEPYRQFVTRRFRRISFIADPVSTSMTIATIAQRKTSNL